MTQTLVTQTSVTQTSVTPPTDPLERSALAALSEELSARIAALESERDALRAQVSSGRALLSMLSARIKARLGFGTTSGAIAGAGSGIPLPTGQALRRARSRGVRIASIVDVGASDGQWTDMCRGVFPDARALLLEANEAHLPALERFATGRRGVEVAIAAVGPQRRQLWFERTPDPYGGRIHETRVRPEFLPLPGTTIDHEVASRGLAGPYLIKLDTHGFEIPILEGALETMRDAQLVVVECYPFRLGNGAPLLHEFCGWMWDHGFMMLDLAEPLWRARDGCLWQVDLVFSPRTRPECGVHSWS